jgi:hypothetical protein
MAVKHDGDGKMRPSSAIKRGTEGADQFADFANCSMRKQPTAH